MKSNEDKLQAACVRWFRYQYPDVVIFAIPNGGSRNAIEAAKLKQTGTLAGVADLFVMCIKRSRGILYHGLFIELKTGKNKQTEAQKRFQEMATEAGYMYQVWRSFDEFRELIEYYLQG